MNNKIYVFIIYVLAFLLIFNMVDFFYVTVISGGTWAFSYVRTLVRPLPVAIAVGYLLYLRRR